MHHYVGTNRTPILRGSSHDDAFPAESVDSQRLRAFLSRGALLCGVLLLAGMGTGCGSGEIDATDFDTGIVECTGEECIDRVSGPVLVSPADGATIVSSTPTFRWTSIEADSYVLNVRSAEPSELVLDEEVSTTEFTLETDLVPGTTYRWKVRGVKNGVEGEWSSTFEFQTCVDCDDTSLAITGVSIEPSSFRGLEGGQTNLVANVTTVGEADDSVTWESDDESIATVETTGPKTATVYHLSPGPVQIRARSVHDPSVSGLSNGIVSEVVQGSSEGDRQALMDLYQATNGDQWDTKTGWSANSMDLNDDIWGVGVEEIEGELRVVHIDLQRGTKTPPEPFSDPTDVLPGNSVQGQLPASLGNLTEIRYFNVKQNNLSGSLPQSLQNWTKVKRVLLGGHTREPKVGRYNHPTGGGVSGPGKTLYTTNKFGGPLPEIFGNMTSLEVFESQYHGLETRQTKDPDAGYTGTLPNNWPSSLQMLFLGGNHFEGSVPVSLTTGNLTVLHLQLNELSGALPPELGNLSDMTHLRLSGNDFTGSFPSEWSGFQSLNLLLISHNNLSGGFPDFMFREGRNEWSTFQISFNNLDGELPVDINASDYPHMNVLGLGWNNFSGSIPNWVTELKLIQHNLDYNSFSGDLPPGYHDSDSRLYQRLRNLRLNNNNLTGPIPQANPGSKIYVYDLGENNFTGTFPPELGDTTTTREMLIRVRNNEMSGKVPANIANIVNLNELFLNGNKFSESDLNDIKNAVPGSVDYRDGNQNP